MGVASARRGSPRERGLRVHAGLLLGLPLLAAACTSRLEVAPAALPPEGAQGAQVMMDDGYTYHFERIRAEGATLVGTYLVVEERVEPDGAIAYVDVQRETRLPLARVTEVSVRRRDWSKTLLVGAGAVIFGVWLNDVLDAGEEEPAAATGKPPQ